MNKSAWWLAGAVLAGAAWALDPPRPAAPPPASAAAPPASEPSEAPPPAAADDAPATATAPAAAEAEPEESLPPLPPGARSTGPTPQRFDPTEKVRADFPVAFPIDI